MLDTTHTLSKQSDRNPAENHPFSTARGLPPAAEPTPAPRRSAVRSWLEHHAGTVLAFVFHLGMGCLGDAHHSTASEETPSVATAARSETASTSEAFEITTLSLVPTLTGMQESAPALVLEVTGNLLPRVRAGSAAAEELAGLWLEARRRLDTSTARPPCFGTAVFYTLDGLDLTGHAPWERAERTAEAYARFLISAGKAVRGQPGLEGYGMPILEALEGPPDARQVRKSLLALKLLTVGACDGRLLVFPEGGHGALLEVPVDLALDERPAPSKVAVVSENGASSLSAQLAEK